MTDDIQKTVSVLREKLRVKEEEASRLKKIINDLYVEEGESAPYLNVSPESSSTLNALRSDQFYGQTLAGATRQYFEMRKASGMGAASVSDIFQALQKGGFKFDAKTDDYSKNALRIALRKNSVTFHRLPNGDYGLLEWYQRPKSVNGEDAPERRSKRRKGRKKREKSLLKQQAAEVTTTATESAKPETTPQSSAPPSRSARILSVLKSNRNKDWDHLEVQKQLPDLDLETIRPLLYSLAKTKKAVKTGPGRFKSA